MRKMPRGTLVVILISARGLSNNNEFFSNVDPYVILTIGSQEHKSTVKEGFTPEWNENFLFTISGDNVSELHLKIMDKDAFTNNHELLGETKIPLDGVFYEGRVPETYHNLLRDEKYCGDAKVALVFIPDEGGAGASNGGCNGSTMEN